MRRGGDTGIRGDPTARGARRAPTRLGLEDDRFDMHQHTGKLDKGVVLQLARTVAKGAEIAGLAVAEAFDPPARGVLVPLPPDVRPDGPDVLLAGPPARMDPADPLSELADATWSHPLRVALVLASHGQAMDAPGYPPEIVSELRRWGLDGSPPPPDAPSLEVEDDPCPRRRHARTVLRRLLRMGKVGAQYHTEFDHLYRGAAPEDPHDALAIGEALARA